MKPLIVLLAVFSISLSAVKFLKGEYEIALPASIAMSAMLLFTSIAHFVFTRGMTMMVPAILPYKTGIVYLTGLIEIAIAVLLLIPAYRTTAAWWLILLFIVLLPANIYAAIKHIDYQEASFTGSGPNYLWFRIPLQIFFIAWTYIGLIKP
jgi:uncharacterized membrane protein